MIGEKVYKDASIFRPERWYKSLDVIVEPSAYAPFSLGALPIVTYVTKRSLSPLVLKSAPFKDLIIGLLTTL